MIDRIGKNSGVFGSAGLQSIYMLAPSRIWSTLLWREVSRGAYSLFKVSVTLILIDNNIRMIFGNAYLSQH
jgi:hypothetical protein